MRGETMDIETLKAVYEEKQAAYQSLCDAVEAAYNAHRDIKALCDKAMAEMHKAGEELLKAVGDRA
jgi:hypothetical protein